MTINKFTIAATACMLTAISCSKTDPEKPQSSDTVPVNIILSIDGQTKASGTSFDDADEIGMYAFRHEEDQHQAFMGVRQFDNLKYTIINGSPKTDAPIYFPKYEDNTDFYMYYPYSSVAVESNSVYQWLESYDDQRSDENFKASDKMIAQALNVEKSPAPIHFQFKRLMSKLAFRLIPGTGYTEEMLEDAQVLLKNIKNSCALNCITMEMESVSTPDDIYPHGTFTMDYWEGCMTGVEGIIPPQEIKAGATLFFVQIGDKKFRGSMLEDVLFEAGKTYTFTMTVNRVVNGDEISVMPEINDWIDGGSYTGDVVEVDPENDAGYVTDIDGNEYEVITLGTQKWLGSNLKTTRLNDGTEIANLPDQTEWDNCEFSEQPAWCYYDNDPENEEYYGLLYNWHAAAKANICPEGWRVPNREDWDILINFLGENGGTKLKATSGWYDVDGGTDPSYQGTDEYGFTAVPCGNRRYQDGFERIDMYCEWWTADQHESYSYSAYVYYLYAKYPDIRSLYHLKETGHAIRCIKNN